MSSTALPIAEAARAFTDSYARAMELASHRSTTAAAPDRRTVAAALAAHYGRTTAYSLGWPGMTWETTAAATGDIDAHLGRFEAAGLGYDIRLEASEIVTLSDSSASCFLTWAIRPAPGSGIEGWSWKNMYAFRRGGAAEAKDEGHRVGLAGEEWTVPEGRWEVILSDAEIGELLKRRPNFFGN